MNYFNNTAKVLPFSRGLMVGVILPHSEKILSEKEIDAKIQTAKGEIDYLTNSLASRTTHGGARYRARQISIKSQIGLANERLELLTSAKKVIETEKISAVIKLAERVENIRRIAEAQRKPCNMLLNAEVIG
jgi:hypothetical protein